MYKGVPKATKRVITRNFKFRSNLQIKNSDIEIASHFVPCGRNDRLLNTLRKVYIPIIMGTIISTPHIKHKRRIKNPPLVCYKVCLYYFFLQQASGLISSTDFISINSTTPSYSAAKPSFASSTFFNTNSAATGVYGVGFSPTFSL